MDSCENTQAGGLAKMIGRGGVGHNNLAVLGSRGGQKHWKMPTPSLTPPLSWRAKLWGLAETVAARVM